MVMDELERLQNENRRLKNLLALNGQFWWANVTTSDSAFFERRVELRTMLGDNQVAVNYGVRVDEHRGFYPDSTSRVSRYKEHAEYELRREFLNYIGDRIGPTPIGIWDDLSHLDKKK